MKPLPISLYCVWQWWEKHYQAAQGRPDRINLDWLDETYLRRQRRLYDWFGDLGIGNPSPTLETGFVSMLLPYHTMIVPVILGMPATIQQIGGWQNHPLGADRIDDPLQVGGRRRLRRAGRSRRLAGRGAAAGGTGETPAPLWASYADDRSGQPEQ